MTLVASGVLWMVYTGDGADRSILSEVSGGAGSPPVTLLSLVAGSNPSVGSAPINMSAFYGHTQGAVNGDLYASNFYTATAYLSYGGYTYESPTTDNVTKKVDNSVTSPVSCFFAEGPAGQPFSDFTVTCLLKRRTKNTTGGWTDITPTGWDTNYTSQSYSCDFSTYDYLFELNTY